MVSCREPQSQIPMPVQSSQMTLLNTSVDIKNSEVLNSVLPLTNILEMIRDDSFCVISDEDDPQLLINIQFTQQVRIKHIIITAPQTDQAPKLLKLYVNQFGMGFEDAEKLNCTQEISNLETNGNKTELKYVKFQTVNFLTLFFEKNKGNDQTRINSIEIWGNIVQDFDVNKIKKSG